jgi:diguanylate cyclase (GGDEF)-like protein
VSVCLPHLPLLVAVALPEGQSLAVVVGLGLVVASTLGFIAGYLTARRPAESPAESVSRGMKALVDRLTTSLDSSLDACDQLEQVTEAVLAAPQVATLGCKQASLTQRLGRFLERQTALVSKAAEEGESRGQTKLEWATQPADGVTGLPGKAAFEANLRQMLATGPAESGVVLARIDRFNNLVERYGATGADALARRFTQVLCRHLRDEDCLCRLGGETWGILMPAVTAVELTQRVKSFRNAVRAQHFRLESHNTEVLVSASFGLSPAYAGEAAELAIDRVQTAVTRAARSGRNQIEIAVATPRLAVG